MASSDLPVIDSGDDGENATDAAEYDRQARIQVLGEGNTLFFWVFLIPMTAIGVLCSVAALISSWIR